MLISFTGQTLGASCIAASNSAAGLDNFTPEDFKMLSPLIFDWLAFILNAVESGAAWPEQLQGATSLAPTAKALLDAATSLAQVGAGKAAGPQRSSVLRGAASRCSAVPANRYMAAATQLCGQTAHCCLGAHRAGPRARLRREALHGAHMPRSCVRQCAL